MGLVAQYMYENIPTSDDRVPMRHDDHRSRRLGGHPIWRLGCEQKNIVLAAPMPQPQPAFFVPAEVKLNPAIAPAARPAARPTTEKNTKREI